MEDLQAIRRLRRGDIGGLECLIARYQGKALRTAFLITHNEPMAEDVVQDVFVRFYERAESFDEARPFEPYFMRSVINTALNCIEREKRAGPSQTTICRNWRTYLKRQLLSRNRWNSTHSNGRSAKL